MYQSVIRWQMAITSVCVFLVARDKSNRKYKTEDPTNATESKCIEVSISLLLEPNVKVY